MSRGKNFRFPQLIYTYWLNILVLPSPMYSMVFTFAVICNVVLLPLDDETKKEAGLGEH